MVAAQQMDRDAHTVGKVGQPFQHAQAVGPAIGIVAEHDQLAGALAIPSVIDHGLELAQKRIELGRTAMYVAHRQ